MIKFENTETYGWEAAIRGMRNPKNSWNRSDSGYCETHGPDHCLTCPYHANCDASEGSIQTKYIIGPNDYDLMKRLRNAGTDHRKYLRMITVYVDITAPLYWWKEFDTYKVGTVANSCSTMHKIHSKEFTSLDISSDKLSCDKKYETTIICRDVEITCTPQEVMGIVIHMLNHCRDIYNDDHEKTSWYQMIQLLPSSYNQKRTIMFNYEVLANAYKSRKTHKLDEWAKHDMIGKITNVTETDEGLILEGFKYFGLCDWIKTLPYSEFITGEFN